MSSKPWLANFAKVNRSQILLAHACCRAPSKFPGQPANPLARITSWRFSPPSQKPCHGFGVIEVTAHYLQKVMAVGSPDAATECRALR